ncbi:MAG: hypothetical protein U5L09_03140 [Bacteroidales bacterium]|nr:hypothetical protein [Bacteroidales bacterium]
MIGATIWDEDLRYSVPGSVGPTCPAILKRSISMWISAERNIPGSGGLAVMSRQKTGGARLSGESGDRCGYFCFKTPLQENVVAHLGFMGSFVEQRVNWDNLVFSDEFDNRYGAIYPTAFTPPATGLGTVRYPDIVIGNILRFC